MNAAPKTALASQFRNESAGDKGTCSRAPEDLGAALRHTVSPMLWSYDSRASGGSLYPHTAGARGKHGGTSHKKRSEIHEKHKFAFGSHQLQRRAGLRSGRLSRPREMQGLPGQGLRHGERQGHPAQFIQARQHCRRGQGVR